MYKTLDIIIKHKYVYVPYVPLNVNGLRELI